MNYVCSIHNFASLLGFLRCIKSFFKKFVLSPRRLFAFPMVKPNYQRHLYQQRAEIESLQNKQKYYWLLWDGGLKAAAR